MMWSKYLRTLVRGEVVAVFHELHPSPVYIPAQRWSTYRTPEMLPNELSEEFKRECLIVKSSVDDELSFQTAENLLLKKLRHVTILYLMTAQGCDLHCRYCPVQDIASRYGASLLSSEAACAGIDLWKRHLDDVFDENRDYHVIFYGGEPLLNKPVIIKSLQHLDYLKKVGRLPMSIKYMVATNGIGVDSEFVTLCTRYNMSVAIGLDGNQATNDALKLDAGGLPTHDRIVEAIHLLVTSDVPTYASCTVTPYNIEQLDEVSQYFKRLGIKKFGFNFLKGRKLIELVGADRVEKYYRQSARAVIRHARNQTEPGFEFQMEKKLKAYLSGEYFPHDCTCYGSQLVIQPDGQISNCPFHKARIGDVLKVGAGFRIWNEPVVRDWRKRLPIYHEGVAKTLSGGGCAWSMIDSKVYDSAPDPGGQIFAEEVLNELIWNR